jgi:hypothetical protein
MRYEIRSTTRLRVDTEELAAGALLAVIETRLPVRTLANLISARGVRVRPEGDDEPPAADAPVPDAPVADADSIGTETGDDGSVAHNEWPAYFAAPLKAAGITTPDEARAYYAEHNSFTSISGLGKKRCAELVKLLGLA